MNLYQRARESCASSSASISFDDGRRVREISYAEFFHNAEALANGICDISPTPRPQIVVQAREPSKFLSAFWAAISLDATAVIAPIVESDTHADLIRRIVGQLDDPIIVGDGRTLDHIRIGASPIDIEAGDDGDLRLLKPSRHSGGESSEYQPVIQYSSGSTGAPKGVQLRAESFIRTAEALEERLSLGAHDSTYSWLPLTHNFALFGFHISATLLGVEQVIGTPIGFMLNPMSWLQRMSELGTTLTGSPNFGLRLLLNAIEKERIRGREPALDLHRLRAVVSGAEPLDLATATNFEKALSAYGSRPHLIAPAYGMSETTVGISVRPPGAPLKSITVDRDRLRIGSRVHDIHHEGRGGLEAVALGTPLTGTSVRIVDDDRHVLEPGTLGHVEVTGPTMMVGYVEQDASPDEWSGENDWFRTGDIGFVLDDEIYLTGRQKDIIFINGKNYYPDDLEHVVLGIRPDLAGLIAVTGAVDQRNGTERIVLFIERESHDPEDLDKEFSDIRAGFGDATHLRIDQMIGVKALPRTSSGKVQRFLLRATTTAGGAR